MSRRSAPTTSSASAAAAAAAAAAVSTASSSTLPLSPQLAALESTSQSCGNNVAHLQQAQESFVVSYQSMLKMESMMMMQSNDANALQQIAQQKAQLEQQIGREAQNLLVARQQVYHELVGCIPPLMQELESFLIQREQWFAMQRQVASPEDEGLLASLDNLQEMANNLLGVLWGLRQHARQLCVMQTQLPLNPHGEPNASQCLLQYNALVYRLLHNCLIVDQQPPQVLKTQTRFTASARFLVGTKLNLHMDPPEVTVGIVNEQQAIQISRDTEAFINSVPVNPQLTVSGDIVNNSKNMSYVAARHHLTSSFKSLQLRKIRRSDKADHTDLVVTEEKFALVFRFSLNGLDTMQVVQALSNPLVVVVHGNQHANAEATVLWDNAFAVPRRIDFAVHTTVQWQQLAQELSKYHETMVGAALNDSHLLFLAQIMGVPSAQHNVTWHKFNKELVPGRPFTFWEWFYGACETSRRHLFQLWREGLITGFIDKDYAQDLLLKARPGNFLLRFSASMVGGVSVSWCTNIDGQGVQVFHLQPWSSRDFNIRGLADRIRDLTDLHYLYPDRPKDECFGPHYKIEVPAPIPQLNDGYVMSDIAVIIRGKDEAPTTYIQLGSALQRGVGAGASRPSSVAASATSAMRMARLDDVDRDTDDDTAMAASMLHRFSAKRTAAGKNPTLGVGSSS